ncbi:MAG: Ig-like domain-containing protein, partial [Bacteroidales bacterium]|nr:Ig-like domain-containing protein [Bacteroidales bacterium]
EAIFVATNNGGDSGDNSGGDSGDDSDSQVASDTTAPSVSSRSPEANAIQVPLNTLVSLTLTDSGDGVDASTVSIQLNGATIYTGDTGSYDSSLGTCTRSGSSASYTYSFQPDSLFNFDQQITIVTNASDQAGNAMSQNSFSFTTEMRYFGNNVFLAACSDPTTVIDSSGTIWAAWHSGDVGSRDVYVGQLNPNTGALSSSVQITSSSADQCKPCLAISPSDRLYLCWQDDSRGFWDVCASSSLDGASWSAEERLDQYDSQQTNPVVAVDSDGLTYVVWQDDRNGHSDILGVSFVNQFTSQTNLTICNAATDQTLPDIAIDNAKTAFVFWTDTRNGNQDIFAAASNASWS